MYTGWYKFSNIGDYDDVCLYSVMHQSFFMGGIYWESSRSEPDTCAHDLFLDAENFNAESVSKIRIIDTDFDAVFDAYLFIF